MTYSMIKKQGAAHKLLQKYIKIKHQLAREGETKRRKQRSALILSIIII